MLLGLSYVDLGIMLLYFGVIIFIGIRASFNIKNQEDYLLGGRKFGKLTSTFASFGQATSADGPAGVATTTFNNGASGIWSSLLMLFVTPLFWITAPWLRRLRMLTMGDFYLERYGSKKMAGTYAIIASIGMMGLLSVGYMAVSKTALAMTPKSVVELSQEESIEREKALELKQLESKDLRTLDISEKRKLDQLRIEKPRAIFSHINVNILIWGICLVVLLYTVLGGLEAAVYTDLLQGLFIILLSIILLPFAWSSINERYGGEGMLQALQHLHQNLPEQFFEIFGSPQTIDFTWYFILTAAIVSGLTVVTQPNQLVTAGAAKDEISARVGFVTGTFMKRIITVLWGMLGLAAILLYSGEITNSDLVWGHATRELLGSLNIGLVGLMLASMMAALMSTADCLMLTVSGLIVSNLYKLVGGAIITTQFDDILQILKFIWEFFVIFAAAFWLGLKWRKSNANGAWLSIGVSFGLFYLIPVLLPLIFPSLKTSPHLLKQTNPDPIEREYTARSMDVEARDNQIRAWNNLPIAERMEKPEKLILGETFTKTFQLPKKSIYWSKSVKTAKQGDLSGSGYIYMELVLLNALGIDLTKNPFALNESIRMLIRLILPFLLLIIGSLLWKQKDERHLIPFYAKMRTPVSELGKEEDHKLVQEIMEDFETKKDMLILPNSSWEFYKWKKLDWMGFLLSWGMVCLVLVLLYFAVTIGS